MILIERKDLPIPEAPPVTRADKPGLSSIFRGFFFFFETDKENSVPNRIGLVTSTYQYCSGCVLCKQIPGSFTIHTKKSSNNDRPTLLSSLLGF